MEEEIYDQAGFFTALYRDLDPTMRKLIFGESKEGSPLTSYKFVIFDYNDSN